jgi:head-tail adaptor
MEPGRLRHEATIERATNAPGPTAGETAESWAPVVILRAEIVPVSSAELIRSGQQESIATHRIRCRWPGPNVRITSRDRVSVREPAGAGYRYFNLVSAANVNERDREMELLAREQQ